MTNMIGRLIDRYPRLPYLLANISSSKLIQLIKDNAIEPVLSREQTVQKIQSLPRSAKVVTEWVLYLLSGAVRTMPEPGHPITVALQEALAESLTLVGIKVNEISTIPIVEQREIIDAALPLVRVRLAQEAREDSGFRRTIKAIGGGAKKFTVEAGNLMSGYRKALRDRRLGGE